eukprot:6054788-Pleurochrysis_carterae.AAC.1
MRQGDGGARIALRGVALASLCVVWRSHRGWPDDDESRGRECLCGERPWRSTEESRLAEGVARARHVHALAQLHLGLIVTHAVRLYRHQTGGIARFETAARVRVAALKTIARRRRSGASSPRLRRRLVAQLRWLFAQLIRRRARRRA